MTGCTHAGGDRIVVDADGYTWRVWADSEGWSMARINPDNSQVPFPVTVYAPVGGAASFDEVVRQANVKRPVSLAAVAALMPEDMQQAFWHAVVEAALLDMEAEQSFLSSASAQSDGGSE